MASSKLNILQKWFEENKIQWDKTSFEITEISSGNFGVRALKDMTKDTPVVKIPKECILSIKTCGISNIIDEQDLEGGCPLALAVLYEMAQGASSPWYGYLQSLPENEELPIVWTTDEKALLKGTEMDAAIQNDMNDLEDDFKDIIEPILEAYPYVFKNTNEDYTFEKFFKVTTLISSRAFQVDAYHENALVPFADLFNHDQKEHVHFETEFDVCDACGVLEYCEHQYLDMLESDEEREEMEKELLENGDADEDEEIVEGEEEEDIEDESDEEEDEEEDDDEMEEMDTELPDLEALEQAGVNFWDLASSDDIKIDTCDMILDRDVLKNEEVFNTYGDHPNIALLSKYGFCFDDNKNDYVSVSEDALVDCCIALTMENLKRSEKDDVQLEERAVEHTGPRYSFFLEHEQVLCPSGEDSDDEDEEEHDDYQEGEEEEEEEDACQDECCPSGDEEHSHHDHTEEGEEHEHDEEGGCCGGDDDEHSQVSRPYYINSEGLFEDKVMCLLHIMFVDQDTFESFTKDFGNALEYFEALSNDKEASGKNKTKKLNETKRTVYQLCHALVDLRRNDYLDENDEWKPISEEIKERKKYANNNMRKYYGLTCRIGEKKIIEKALEYYESQFKGITTHKSAEHPKKEAANKRRKL